MLPGHKIHNSVACTVDGISTVRSATILRNIEGCEKVYSKNNTSIEGCERTDSENITHLFVELKNC
jgi:hypothetical protein